MPDRREHPKMRLYHDKPCSVCGKMERVGFSSRSPGTSCLDCRQAIAAGWRAGLSREQSIEKIKAGEWPGPLGRNQFFRNGEIERDKNGHILPKRQQRQEVATVSAPIPPAPLPVPPPPPAPEPVPPAENGGDGSIHGLLVDLVVMTDRARELIGQGKVDALRTALDVSGVRLQFGATRIEDKETSE